MRLNSTNGQSNAFLRLSATRHVDCHDFHASFLDGPIAPKIVSFKSLQLVALQEKALNITTVFLVVNDISILQR